MLAQFYPPVVGGEENAVQSLSRELVRRGHEVHVATTGEGPDASESDDEGVRVHRLPTLLAKTDRLHSAARRQLPPGPDPELTRRLHALTRRVRPDVVHAHNWIVHSYVPVKRRLGVPLVLSAHDFSLVCATKRFLHHREPCSGPGPAKCLGCARGHYGGLRGVAVAGLLGVTAPVERRRLDHILPVSSFLAEELRLGTFGVPHTVIPNFIPGDLLRAADAAPDAPLPDGEVVLFAGDLSRDKGFDVVLRAAPRLRERAQLVAVGREMDVSLSEARAAGITVLDPVSRPTLLRAFAAATVSLVPSAWREPFGLVALESMAMGAAVVASATGGLTDMVVDDDTGLLVTPGDADGLADATLRLLDDPALRARLGTAARRRVDERFSATSVLPQMEDVYRSVAPGPRG